MTPSYRRPGHRLFAARRDEQGLIRRGPHGDVPSQAVAIARGEVTVQAGGVARLLGHVAECCRAAAAEGPGLFYAPGHVGVTGNEIADVVAKAAGAGVPLGSVRWVNCDDPGWWSEHGLLWSWASSSLLVGARR